MSHFRNFTAALLLIFIFFASGQADEGLWTQVTKPYKMGMINDISSGWYGVDHYIMVATGEDGQTGKVWRSTDEGLTWQDRRPPYGAGQYCYRLAVEPDQFTEAWLVVRGPDEQEAGPYYTENRGDVWDRRVNGLTGSLQFTALAARPVGGDLTNVFIGRTASNNEAKIFKWDGTNQLWFRSDNGLPADEEGTVYDLDISPLDQNRIVCAYEGGAGHNGIYYSDDGGGTWQRVDFSGSDASAMQAKIYADEANDNGVIVGEKYPDYGRLWLVKLGYSPPFPNIPGYLPTNWIDCPDIESYARGTCPALYFAFSSPDDEGEDWTVAKRTG